MVELILSMAQALMVSVLDIVVGDGASKDESKAGQKGISPFVSSDAQSQLHMQETRKYFLWN